MRRLVFALALGLALGLACGDDECTPGTEGCPCRDVTECDEGLRCNIEDLMYPEQQNEQICVRDDDG